ncbi:HAE1 family hydrophobic/amphiphilic exporter-1 [Roseibium hamelinense]|uniref:Efflux pump membrane transporter n=1 Tax=Roseibium hamelinense TaxID=150831 RepID=A0A562SME0_9HYPH|nr:efflux RND transporter permease subunit [Roseibium hamelinense]MTI43261.1 efflux RND transporter permease subunit [Roseibium hamelinense]TWI81810.1 HAE1 family hydrophobic/amphiphilic exporter-1 [Roseibium hamelinense]
MLSKYFIDRPNFAFVIAILTVLVGALSIRFLPVAQFPNIAPQQIQVTATYPGADASLIQNSVATPIEEEVNGVEGMIYMSSSSSSEGTYQLTVTFAIGTDPDIAAVNVQNRVALATPLLPEAVTQQGISTSKQNSNMLQVINLLSPKKSHSQLYLSNYAADFLQDPLSRINGVGSVSQFGPLNYSMRVWLDPEKMAALNLSASDVSAAIKAQNVEAAAGQIGAPPFADEKTAFQFSLQADGLLETPDQFEQIILSAQSDGSFVRLKDIARVELGAESYAATAYYNGQPSAIVAVFQESGANALDVADAVRVQMEELSKHFPADMEYVLAYDVTTAVRKSIEEIAITLGITALLVISVTFFFLLSARATLIPAIAIPVSLLGTMALIYVIGFSANMITLFAIVLAITLVVDDAIVIIENTERIMEEEGLEPREATLKAMSQVTRPIIATTFVLAAVFVPVCFFPGITGEIYLQFALTITFAFALSAVNALTLGPVLCSMFLSRRTGHPKGLLKVIPKLIDKVRDAYMAVVRLMLRFITVSLLLFVGVVAATVYLFETTPTGFIPPEDNGVLFVSVELPDGASLQRTQTVIQDIGAKVQEHEGIQAVTSVAGFSIIAGNKSNVGLLVLLLEPWDQRKTRDTQWWAIMMSLNRSLAAVPEATSFVFPLPAIQGVGSSGGLSAQLLDYQTGNIEDFDAVKTAFLTALLKEPEFQSAFSSFSATSPQYHLTIDRDRAEALQVKVSDIFTALQASFGSLYVNNFVKDGRVYWVVMSADAPFRQTTSRVEGIYVKNAAGDALPLRTFITADPTLGAQTIYRYNLFTSAAINAQLVNGVSSGDAIQKFSKIANENLPDGYGYEWTDVTLQEVEAGGLVTYILILAVVFAYLCMVAQYESWVLPLSVMASAVFAVFGALLPLQLIPNLNNNIYAQIGMVLLIGLAAKKAIMVVEFAKNLREEGHSIQDAALMAAHMRFRPVTMTGLCFILGVLPLVMASGAGAAGRLSIGFPVFVGMIVDSTLGLLMIPVLYVFFQTVSEKIRGGRDKRPDTEESAEAS